MRRSDADPRPMPRGCSRVRDKSTTHAPQDAHTLTSTYPLTELHTPLRNPHRSPRHTSHLPPSSPAPHPPSKKTSHTPNLLLPSSPLPSTSPTNPPFTPHTSPAPPPSHQASARRSATSRSGPSSASAGNARKAPCLGTCTARLPGEAGARALARAWDMKGGGREGGVVVMVSARLFGFGLGLEVRGRRMGALGVGAVVGLQSECWRG